MREENAAKADTAAGRPAPPLAARGLGLKGPRGWVYRDVDLTVARGQLAVISGESGSGRSALLLTLAGRMRPTAGTVAVAGRTRLGEIQRRAALGPVTGVNELDGTLTVAEHVFEVTHLRRGLLPRRRGRRTEEVAAALSPVGLDLSPDAIVAELRPRERVLFGAALALMADPALLLLDDVDAGMPRTARRAVWERLGALDGVTTVATCVEPEPAAELADVEVALP